MMNTTLRLDGLWNDTLCVTMSYLDFPKNKKSSVYRKTKVCRNAFRVVGLMETRSKVRFRKKKASWLNLHEYIPQRDIRKKIYSLLGPADKFVVKCAHATARKPKFNLAFAVHCAGEGHVSLLQWAFNNNFYPSESVYEAAVMKGRLNVLQWIDTLPYRKLLVSVCDLAAYYGHLHIVQWAYLSGGFPRINACVIAAEQGHLHVLKWLRENGCPWDEAICGAAAFGGQLETLKWARANGCPWNVNVLHYAMGRGKYEIVEWIDENGFE